MTTLMGLTEMSPAEVDGIWNDAHVARAAGIRRVTHDLIEEREARALGFYGNRSKSGVYQYVESLTVEDVLQRIEKVLADIVILFDFETDWQIRDLQRKEERLLTGRAAIVEADDQLKACDAEWKARGGWSRFYRVVSSAGKVHQYGCGSWRWTTQIALETEYSGSTPDDVVAGLDAEACSRCFKDAPVVAADAAVDPNVCTNQYKTTNTRGGYRKYADCPECGRKAISLTSTGKLRKHTKDTQ